MFAYLKPATLTEAMWLLSISEKSGHMFSEDLQTGKLQSLRSSSVSTLPHSHYQSESSMSSKDRVQIPDAVWLCTKAIFRNYKNLLKQ